MSVTLTRDAPDRILLVEDQAQVRATLERALRYHAFEVVAVASPGEAQDCILRERIDLLLTDVSLSSHGAGFDLARWARQRLPALPIVVISGLALSDPPDWLLADPAVRLLAKPFLTADLLRAIAAVRVPRPG